ncbi:MAG: helix-turn-helix transcriptional regulator [Lachnospiraceae bacterium]|nr:helix-turn-helix transcriptional regulator [Lachnospiraceae bacterium]
MRDYYAEMGQRIGDLRRERHITQETFAEDMDISVKHCSHVERGMASYSLEKLIDVADYFDVSIDYIVRGTNPDDVALSFPSSMVEIMRSGDEEEKALLREYLNMFDKLRSNKANSESED